MKQDGPHSIYGYGKLFPIITKNNNNNKYNDKTDNIKAT